MRYNYHDLEMSKVTVRGIMCEFTDARVERSSVPEGKRMYEVADGDSDGIPARIRRGILVNFFGTLVTEQELLPDEGDTIYLEENDWAWEPYTPVEHLFLVQRKFDDGTTSASVMTELELVSYINMADCHGESYCIFCVTEFGKAIPCHYVGWQPQCRIQVIGDEHGEIFLDGYGEDH